MAGTVIDRPISAGNRATGRTQFRLATKADDPAIRRLLRENPTRGDITLSFEREPDYFRGTSPQDDWTILAFDRDRLICMGRCSVSRRYINGEPRRAGYLSELRLDASAAGRFDVLRRGYQFFRELLRADPPELLFTSIATDNARSIQFLERGLPGMPAYERLFDFVTLLIAVPRGPAAARRLANSAHRRLEAKGFRFARGNEGSAADLCASLNLHAANYQLARQWSESDLPSLAGKGLPPENFRVALNGEEVVAGAALWDQRGFRQTVIRGYSPRLALARRCLNVAASLFGTPSLPAVNSILAHGFLSPLAANTSDLLLALVEISLADGAERGLEFVTLGFAAGDPRLEIIRNHFRAREYASRFYRVDWPGAARETLDPAMFCPEVAWL
jgi:hypothetical protein